VFAGCHGEAGAGFGYLGLPAAGVGYGEYVQCFCTVYPDFKTGAAVGGGQTVVEGEITGGSYLDFEFDVIVRIEIAYALAAARVGAVFTL
jgi:hypothetical protein